MLQPRCLVGTELQQCLEHRQASSSIARNRPRRRDPFAGDLVGEKILAGLFVEPEARLFGFDLGIARAR